MYNVAVVSSDGTTEELFDSANGAKGACVEALDFYAYHCRQRASIAKNDKEATVWRGREKEALEERDFAQTLTAEQFVTGAWFLVDGLRIVVQAR